MRSKKATPLIIRKHCIQHNTVSSQRYAQNLRGRFTLTLTGTSQQHAETSGVTDL